MSASRPGLWRPRAYRYRPRRRREGEASRMGAFDAPARRNAGATAPVSRAQLAYAAGNVEWFKARSRARAEARAARIGRGVATVLAERVA